MTRCTVCGRSIPPRAHRWRHVETLATACSMTCAELASVQQVAQGKWHLVDVNGAAAA